VPLDLARLVRPHRVPAGRRYRPRLEPLEGRCVPTVTTSFSAGTLTIIGSSDNNHVTVTEAATHGSYTVSATDGVTGDTSFTNVTNIAIDLKGGDSFALGVADTADFAGDAGANAFLDGTLSVTGAGGLLVGFQSNFNAHGAVSVTTTTAVGQLIVKTGATSLANSMATNVSLGPTTVTNNGTGATLFGIQGVSANDVAIRGGLSVTMGSGNNSFGLLNVAVAGGVTTSGGSTQALITLQKVTVGGFVSLNGTATNSGITANISQATIGTFFSVASGNGNDTVGVNVVSVLGLGLQPQQQTFGVSLKGGTNTSNVGTVGADAANVIHGSLFHFGAGTENFNLQNYTITSFVTVNAQAGNNGLTANIAHANISNFLSCAAAGAAADSVTVDSLSIGQNFALDLGGGTNTSAITNNHYLGSYSEIDAGVDIITFTGNVGFGDVKFTAGRLTINTDKFLNNQIAGNASFTSTGNTDRDLVNLGPALGTAVSAANAVTIGKALLIDIGSSTALGDLVAVNNVSVQADLTVNAVPTNAEDFRFTNVKAGRNFSFNAGASPVSLTVVLGSSGTPNTGPVTVLGDLTITTGTLNDDVDLTDVTVGGATTITTNDGTDHVFIEFLVSGVAGPSLFYGAVAVSAGGGNDTVRLGLDAANQARFYAAVTLDGGPDTDVLDELAPQYVGGPPTKTSIP
jgi:hypothetical protein